MSLRDKLPPEEVAAARQRYAVTRAAELLDDHTYATSVAGSGTGPRVCRCGHREKPQDGEPLQDVHRRHLLATLADAGLLVTPEHDQQVILNYLRTQHTPTVRIENPEQIVPFLAKAWDEGYKQGGPMHDVDYDDPDAHTRNPYRREAGESGADA